MTPHSFLVKANLWVSVDTSRLIVLLSGGSFVEAKSLNRLYQSTDIIDFRLLTPFPLRSMCPRLWPTTTTSSMLGPWPGQSRWISLLRDSPLALGLSLVIPLRWIDCAQLQSAALDAPQARTRRIPVMERKRKQEREGRERERERESESEAESISPMTYMPVRNNLTLQARP